MKMSEWGMKERLTWVKAGESPLASDLKSNPCNLRAGYFFIRSQVHFAEILFVAFSKPKNLLKRAK